MSESNKIELGKYGDTDLKGSTEFLCEKKIRSDSTQNIIWFHFGSKLKSHDSCLLKNLPLYSCTQSPPIPSIIITYMTFDKIGDWNHFYCIYHSSNSEIKRYSWLFVMFDDNNLYEIFTYFSPVYANRKWISSRNDFLLFRE